MKTAKWILLLLVFYSINAGAEDISGSMHYDGTGNYSISAIGDDSGKNYSGYATDEGDGNFDVSLTDDDGNSYSGSLTSDGNGNYSVDATGDDNENDLSGTLTLN